MKWTIAAIAFLLVLIACSTTIQETAVSKPVVQPSNSQQQPATPALETQVKAPQEVVTPEDKMVPNLTSQKNATVANAASEDGTVSCPDQCETDCESDAKLACKQHERSSCKANCGDIIDPSACTQACTYINQPQSCVSLLEQFCKARCVQICK